MNAEILIVDDIPANLNVLRQTLEPEGYEIIAAASGEVALKIAAQAQPSLILLDVMMPGLDGFETCHRLKAEKATADIPVIFITAKDETQSIVKGFEVGGVDYITKPFRHEEVRARVKTHLTIKRLRDELERSYLRLEADNARKTEELETARIIQQGFLPVSIPVLPYLEIAAFQKPATEVGGDYYDFFLKPGEGSEPSPGFAEPSKLVVAIGDATGHGVGASLMVSATKTALLTIDEPDLTRRVSRVNTLLKQINSYHRLNMALTLVELAYDANSSTVRVKAAGGGMPPLYILRSNAGVEEIGIEGLPLGAMEGAKYRSTEFRLEKSEMLILMSDGLTERFNDTGEILGDIRLVAEIEKAGKMGQSASGILEALVKLGDDWSNHTPQNDDVTLVALKVK
ncbi:SpoIIE family protein phosphatase [Candidatus Poribacteria bacterium]|nr:SpoIIE family protein phosphatase [Candidatus Poribacteria bacterium]